MLASARAHVLHHARFYIAVLLGAAAGAATPSADPSLRLAIAGDVFFGAYLILMAPHAPRLTPDALRERARIEDEGMPLIILITLAAATLGIVSMFSVLNRPEPPDALYLVLSFASVPLGWLTLHMVMAWHYAHEYYAPHPSGGAAHLFAGPLSPAFIHARRL